MTTCMSEPDLDPTLGSSPPHAAVDLLDPEYPIVAARAAHAKGGIDILVLRVGDVLAITDYFVIVSASNPRLVRTVVQDIEQKVAEAGGPRPLRVEGLNEAEWVLADYGAFVVHVFHTETRQYYELERLWSDVPAIDWVDPEARVPPADAGGADRLRYEGLRPASAAGEAPSGELFQPVGHPVIAKAWPAPSCTESVPPSRRTNQRLIATGVRPSRAPTWIEMGALDCVEERAERGGLRHDLPLEAARS